MKKNILFIGGSLNQTTMMHQISEHLCEHNCYFTPFYAESLIGLLTKIGLLNFTILGGQHRKNTEAYLAEHDLAVDFGGKERDYDLVFTCTDTLIQKNIKGKRLILVQEGMTEPEGFLYQLVKRFKLPRYIANTAATGLSDIYDLFCVASKGYRDLFIKKGVRPDKIAVTGIPNFDHVDSYLENDFPHHDYVLAATSSNRETLKLENREEFIRWVIEIAAGRKIIFKLHPNENLKRASQEIKRLAPEALILQKGNINQMIANCSVLVTQTSSVTFIGLAMGKEVHTYLDQAKLKKILPVQNGGTSSQRIATLGRLLLNLNSEDLKTLRSGKKDKLRWQSAKALYLQRIAKVERSRST
jgi:hypothetical protein